MFTQFLLAKKKKKEKKIKEEKKKAKVCLRNEVNRRNTQLVVFCGWMWLCQLGSGELLRLRKRREV